jgi:hypothetical protein
MPRAHQHWSHRIARATRATPRIMRLIQPDAIVKSNSLFRLLRSKRDRQERLVRRRSGRDGITGRVFVSVQE